MSAYTIQLSFRRPTLTDFNCPHRVASHRTIIEYSKQVNKWSTQRIILYQTTTAELSIHSTRFNRHVTSTIVIAPGIAARWHISRVERERVIKSKNNAWFGMDNESVLSPSYLVTFLRAIIDTKRSSPKVHCIDCEECQKCWLVKKQRMARVGNAERLQILCMALKW